MGKESRAVDARIPFLHELDRLSRVLVWRSDNIRDYAADWRGHPRTRGPRIPPPGALYRDPVPARALIEDRLFGEIEAFLAGWARVSLILDPAPKGRRKWQETKVEANQRRENALNRGADLSGYLTGMFPATGYLPDPAERRKWIRERARRIEFSRFLRDGWMHMDEHLDHYLAEDPESPLFLCVESTNDPRWDNRAIRVLEIAPLHLHLRRIGAVRLLSMFADAADLRDLLRIKLDSIERFGRRVE